MPRRRCVLDTVYRRPYWNIVDPGRSVSPLLWQEALPVNEMLCRDKYCDIPTFE